MANGELNLVNFLFMALPSGIAYACVGPALLGIYLKLRSAVIIGAIGGASTLIVREVGVPLGFHSLVSLLILVLLLVLVARLTLRTAALAAFLSTAVFFIAGNLLIIPVLYFLHISIQEAMAVQGYRIFMAWVSEVLPAVIVTLVARRFGVVIYRAPEAGRRHEGN